MKIIYFAPFLFLLAACINPQKFIEQSNYEKALAVSSRQLKKGKPKWNQLDAFEKSLAELNRRDALEVDQMRAAGHPELWPKIYTKALQISRRQQKVAPVIARLKGGYFEAVVTLYPAKELLEEAADKSALYYYASAMGYVETARNGNRQNARLAHGLLVQCRYYRTNFKDAFALQQEMFALGTTYILVKPIVGMEGSHFQHKLINTLIGYNQFPIHSKWQVVHLDPKKIDKPHYLLEVNFHNFYISGESESSSSCCNTETVEDGYTETQVWNPTDSVWVTVKETIYTDVSVQVITYEQSKSASLKMHFSMVDANSNQEIYYQTLSASGYWSNTYSTVCGDTRALSFSCSDEGGSCSSFPLGEELLIGAAANVRPKFYSLLQRGINKELWN